jgi:hypothetical protein
MLSTFLNYISLNLAIASYVTGWIITKKDVHIGSLCKLNQHTRVRFSSNYCDDNSFMELLEFSGVLTIPYFIYWGVLTVILSLFLNLFIKIMFGKMKKAIVFLEVIGVISSISSILLFNDTIISQNIFVDSNSQLNYTGYMFQFTTMIFLCITSILSIIKINNTNDKKLVWVN